MCFKDLATLAAQWKEAINEKRFLLFGKRFEATKVEGKKFSA